MITLRALAVKTRRAWPLVLLLFFPGAASLWAWHSLVVPQRERLQAWRDTEAVTEVKPRLERQVADGQRLLSDWETTQLSRDDRAAVTDAVRRLAEQHLVTIEKISTKAYGDGKKPRSKRRRKAQEEAASGAETIPVEVHVRGRFNRLAYWISELEQAAGLRIDEWWVNAPTEPGGLSTLMVRFTARLRKRASHG